MDGFEIKHVSKAELGQLRPPSQADIQRRAAAFDQTSDQKQAYRQSMARLEKSAMQFVATKQQDRQQAAQQKAPDRSEPLKAPPRHNSVAQTGYGDQASRGSIGRARTPEHVAIQRSIQGHIQRNQQQEARTERFRQLGQQVKEKAAAMVKPFGRSERNVAQSMPPPSLGKAQTAQSELASKQKMQSMSWHRERTQGKEVAKEQSRVKEPVRHQAPIQQHQQQKGKEQDRGRTR